MTNEPSFVRHPLGSGTAATLTPTVHGTSILQTASHLVPLLAQTGHLLLRGFNPTLDDFNDLVRKCSARITLDPARMFHGDVAQKVDSGHDAIGLHIENGATPYPPDMLWFHCITAASQGSQTTVCDGQRVWRGLDAVAQNLFRGRKVIYSRRVKEKLWRDFTAFSLNDGREPEEVVPDDLRRLSGSTDTEVIEHSDGSITYRHASYAARATRWSSEIAWANSIFGPSYNYEAPDIRFADGREIPQEVLDHVADTAERVTEEIAWQGGDVVLIDNSRVMHGRRAILDPERNIVNAQSFAPTD
ncbi:TauD/TfdA family dioxygenase [Streptomyces cucumeris]|uniref:TauD/TfdA family dioxygenase n=1 Tax=Streptomyces cucumeris TaxID=2962890 RepID=UPI003D73F6E7